MTDEDQQEEAVLGVLGNMIDAAKRCAEQLNDADAFEDLIRRTIACGKHGTEGQVRAYFEGLRDDANRIAACTPEQARELIVGEAIRKLEEAGEPHVALGPTSEGIN